VLVVLALVLVVLAVRARRRAWVVAALIGAFGVIGAGFNGGSLLNDGHDFSSLLMSIGVHHRSRHLCERPVPDWLSAAAHQPIARAR
jgi:hypothetical protein